MRKRGRRVKSCEGHIPPRFFCQPGVQGFEAGAAQGPEDPTKPTRHFFSQDQPVQVEETYRMRDMSGQATTGRQMPG